MELPLQITFHSVEQSDAISAKVRERAEKLDKFFDSINSCRVAIEAPHHHHAKGNRFRVRVEVSVPGQQLVVTRGGDERETYTDVYIAIRDAFDVMTRQLEDYSTVLRGELKTPHHRPESTEGTERD
jgi:ribosomal subunit interface protein